MLQIYNTTILMYGYRDYEAGYHQRSLLRRKIRDHELCLCSTNLFEVLIQIVEDCTANTVLLK